MTVILVVFLLTAIFVKVDMAPLPFFSLTMIKIICINCEFLNTSPVQTALDAEEAPNIIELFHQSVNNLGAESQEPSVNKLSRQEVLLHCGKNL